MTTACATRVILAEPRGFCAGVRRAVEIVELALRAYGPPVWVRHAIVHNERVLERLEARGACFVEDLEAVPPGAPLVLSAHGVAPDVGRAARARGLRVIDATCPLVAKVHAEVLRYAARGYEILVVGHPGHVEVEGTLGHAPGRARVVASEADAETVPVRDPARVAAVTQTTLSVDDAERILARLRRRFPRLATPRKDDVCYATQNRQLAVKRLARRAPLVLVVGSASSSNTARLVEVARACGARAERLAEASELRTRWLGGLSAVGVTAGASAPESQVEALVARLVALGCGPVETLPGPAERAAFGLPAELAAHGAPR